MVRSDPLVRLQPVERKTLARAVIGQLVDYIQSGAIKPGEALPSQHELARQLSVSRPVLREAMQGFAAIGLIEIRPGSGCYVRKPNESIDPEALVETFTHETALEVLEARMVVEVELAAFAAERATAADVCQLEAILRRLKTAISRGQQTTMITLDFHRALARAGHNAVLFRMAQTLTSSWIAQGMRVEHALPEIPAQEYENHRRLFDAVRSGDPAAARHEMREHLEIAHGWEEQIAALRHEIAGAVTPVAT